MFNKQQITLLMAFCMERSIDGQECIQLIVDMGMPASELIPQWKKSLVISTRLNPLRNLHSLHLNWCNSWLDIK